MNLEYGRFFNLILDDLEYAKNMKSPEVLFTSDGNGIGYGEDLCYIRTSIRPIQSQLRNIILKTKDIASFQKKMTKDILTLADDKDVLLVRTHDRLFNKFGEITLGMSENYMEYYLKNSINYCESLPIVYSEDLSDTEFINNIKNSTADSGLCILKVDKDHVISANKKLLPLLRSDKLSMEIRDNNEENFFIAKFTITSGKRLPLVTYIKYLSNR